MLKNIIYTLSLLLFNPIKGWEKAKDNRDNHDEFINNFLFPIFGFISITTFVGGMWMSYNGGIHYALKQIMIVISALFGGFFLASILINELFPKYGLIKSNNIAQQFVGQSSIIIYLLYLVMPLISGLNVLWLISLTSFFLIYTGTKYFLTIENERRIIFSILSLFIILLCPMLLNYLLHLAVI